uniref:Uncharacterized protein n=1 Tax=Arcella intermedia TaxID=1963864 RepID=A0A6B2LVP0_9EUKA
MQQKLFNLIQIMLLLMEQGQHHIKKKEIMMRQSKMLQNPFN